jgi:beta-fructofuranosidase
MGFELQGNYVWDFWIARDGQDYHLYCLTAPKTDEHPDLRHPHARIGHATSKDLKNWTYHGVAIGPSAQPAWDDGVTWTGSAVLRPDGKWMMFYTGCQTSENCKIQRIGAAVSTDLHTWEKLEKPLLELDAAHYESYDPARWHDQAFRDPWVYPAPDGNGWRMLFTARDPHGPAKGAGVIGQASSPDLLNWTVGEPICTIGYYGEMEVPQLFDLDGWWYCLFSNSSRHREPSYLAHGKAGMATGTHYIRSRSPSGPFELVEEEFFAGDDTGHFYGGRVVEMEDGALGFMAFLNHDAAGGFVGAISDPMAIWTTPEGYLRIDARKYGLAMRTEAVDDPVAIDLSPLVISAMEQLPPVVPIAVQLAVPPEPDSSVEIRP